MEMQKVLIVRVKGGIGDAVAMTRYILKGLSCGVLVLPDEVISYSVEELPVLHESSLSLTESLVSAGLLDEGYTGKPPADDPATEIPDAEVLPTLTFQEKESAESADEPIVLNRVADPGDAKPEQAAGSFKPKGG